MYFACAFAGQQATAAPAPARLRNAKPLTSKAKTRGAATWHG
jgi:hypothetical protein